MNPLRLSLAGTAGNDSLLGTGADETFEGGAGNDTIDGGGGTDVAVFAGGAGSYRFGIAVDGTLRVQDGAGADGTDTLGDIDELRFADRSIGVSGSGATQVNDGAIERYNTTSIATLANGDYILAWVSATNVADIRAQRFGADGVEKGAEFRINSSFRYLQLAPAVTALPDGGFVAVWNSVLDTTTYRLVAQRFAADGARAGGEFVVSAGGVDLFSAPAVTALAGGGFAIAWRSGYELHARVYGAGGRALGPEQVASPANVYDDPHVTALALDDGGFLLGWEASEALDDWGVFTRRFDAHGNPLGDALALHQDTAGLQNHVRFASLAGGGLVAVWSDNASEYGNGGTFARLLDAHGAPLGAQFQVSESTLWGQSDATVAALAGGGFVVVWTEGFYGGVRGQRYNADGERAGDDFRVDPFQGDRRPDLPALSALADGGFVVAWRDREQVFTRRFDAQGHGDSVELQGTAAADRLDLTLDGPLAAAGGAGDDTYVVNEAGDRVRELPGSGYDTVESTTHWTLGAALEQLLLRDAGGAIDGTGNALANRIEGNAFANRIEGGEGDDTLLGGAGNDTAVYLHAGGAVAVDLGADAPRASGAAGNDALSGFENATGGNYADSLRGGNGPNRLEGGDGNDTLAGAAGNDTLDGGRGTDSAVFSDRAANHRFGAGANGALLVEDRAAGVGDDGRDELHLVETLGFADRRFTVQLGGEFHSGAAELNEQQVAAAPLPGGGFVLTWQSAQPSTAGGQLWARCFDATGAALGEAFTVGERYGYLEKPVVRALDGGGFVIGWSDGDNLHFQRYTDAGVPQGAGQLVDANLPAAGTTRFALSALDGGGFIATWQVETGSGGADDLYAQRFAPDGSSLGGPILLRAIAGYEDLHFSACATAGGGFALAWSQAAPGSQGTVYLKRYDADGIALGAAATVITTLAREPLAPAATALANGDIVVSWITTDDGRTGMVMHARLYASDGSARGPGFQLGECAWSDGIEPVVAALAHGGFVACWSNWLGNDLYELQGRRFDDDGIAQGEVFRVNTTPGEQWHFGVVPAVAALEDGGFVVSWAGPGGAADTDLYWQRFDARGQAVLSGIRGTAGDDTLDISGGGPLAAQGGTGDDTYLVNEALDRTVERGGEGSDTVRASIDWTLAANVEDLVLAFGAGAVDGTGNALSNLVRGNGSANVLDGRGGADTLDGGAGTDTASYAYARAAVRVDLHLASAQASGGGGADTLIGIENLAGSRFADTLTGDDGANRLFGAAGNDTLDGGSGEDLLIGGAGTDLLRGGDGDDLYLPDLADRIDEAAGGGTDTVQSGASSTLGANLENLVLTGTAPVDGTGNEAANAIEGNAAANVLRGLGAADVLRGNGGDDRLAGGAGNDTLTGGDGADTYVFDTPLSATANVELVTDFDRLGDHLELDTRVFTGFAPGHEGSGAAILYDQASGEMYYDPDGGGDMDPILFARFGLVAHPEITGGDLVFVS